MCAVADPAKFVLETAYNGLTVKPGRSVVVAGNNVAWDDCCDGQLSVRVVTVTPIYKGSPMNGCPVGTEMVLGVGIVRCISTLDDRGMPPTEAEMMEDGSVMLRDMRELGNALQCVTVPGALASWMGEWTPLGAMGGCAGGEWEFRVRLPLPL